MDWVFITLALAMLLLLVGVSMFVWMFSQREYWKADPTMPSVFVMFSKIINGSTIGVLCVFIAAVIATAAVLLWFLRSKHEQVLANQSEGLTTQEQILANQAHLATQNEQIIGILSSGRVAIKQPAFSTVRSDTGEYRILRPRSQEHPPEGQLEAELRGFLARNIDPPVD